MSKPRKDKVHLCKQCRQLPAEMGASFAGRKVVDYCKYCAYKRLYGEGMARKMATAKGFRTPRLPNERSS